MTDEQQRYVILNGQKLPIKGMVQKRPITPWVARISTGEMKYSDYTPANRQVWGALKGGLGLNNWIAGADDRYVMADGMECALNKLCLSGLVTSTGAFGVTPTKICSFESKVWGFAHHQIAYGTGAAWTVVLNTFDLPTDACTWFDVQWSDTYLCAASQTAAAIFTNSHTGAAWANLADNAVDGPYDGSWFAKFDNRLFMLTWSYYGLRWSEVNTITGGVSVDWTRTQSIPALPVLFKKLFVGKNAADEECLYFTTTDGLYYLDFFTQTFGRTEVSWANSTNAGKAALYWKGDIYVSTGKGILKVTEGVVTAMGPDRDDGLPSEFVGTITDAIGTDYWLIISVDGGASNKSCILRKYITGNAWHPLYCTSATNKSIGCLFYEDGRLYFGEGTSIKYLDLPDETDNVLNFAAHTYAASGEVILPKTDCGFAAIKKVALSVEAITADCNTTEYFTIYYRTDANTAWTTLGTFKTSPHPTALTFPVGGANTGLEFDTIQFKIGAIRDAGTTTVTPEMEALVFAYLPIPEPLYGWGFTVQCRREIIPGKAGKDLLDALITAYETKTLLAFYPDGDPGSTVHYVKIQNLPGAEKGEEFGQEGDYIVQVSEVT